MTLALTKKEDPDVEHKITLNVKQKLCIEKINHFISQNTDKYFYLLGYAGTGKTFLIGKIIRDLLYANKMDHIFVCAPTHQALYVMESYLKSNLSPTEQVNFLTKMSFMTIHKLLEFKPVIMAEDGSKIFKSNKESKFLKQMEDKLIVIDECSMISKEMVAELNKYIDLYPIKVIFLGDQAQLPPVHETESIIFSTIPKGYKHYILLDEIMRTKSPDIKTVSTIIRNWNQKDTLNKLLLPIHSKKSATKTFKLYHKKPNYLEATWFKSFIAKLDEGKIPIILTWRNNAADTYNKVIRKHVHKVTDLNNYVCGDYAMFNNYYTSPEDNSSFYTSNMIKIVNINTEKKVLFDWSKILLPEQKTIIDKGLNILIKKLAKLQNEFHVESFTVERIYSDTNQIVPGKTYNVQTIQRSDLEEYREMLKLVQEHIEFFYKKYKSEPHANKLWDVYHKRLVDPYAELSFGYSITTHKSQGSTFDTVFVDVDDISQNPDVDELQHMLYTAATRCSNELGFLLS